MESDQTTETESDRSDFSDGEMEQFSHNFIPGDRGVGNSEDSDEYGIYYGDSSKYPPMFDTNIDSGATGDLFHSLKQQGEIFDGNQNQNRENIHNIITKLNSSYPDSAYGTGHSLYAINESGSTVTETDSDTNSEGTISNSESPVHNPVYGRYQKLPATLNKPPVVPASEVHSDNSCEMLILHRLPGENLGMILGIEGGKDSFGKVSAVSVKSVTLGGAAYRATGSSKGMCVGDELMTVNGTDLLSLTHDECISVFKDMPLRVQLSIKRGQKNLPAVAISPLHFERKHALQIPRSARRDISDSEDEALGGFVIYQVDIFKDPNENLGLSIVPSYGSTKEFYQIKRILPSGAAARSTHLRVGDRLISCNGQPLQGLTQNHCLNILRTESSHGDIQLEVVRPIDNRSSMKISVALNNNNSQLPLFDPGQYSIKSQSYDRHTDVVVTSESDDYLTVSEDEYSRTRLADIPEVEANEVFANNNFKLAYQNQFNTIEEDTTETETEDTEKGIPSDVDIVDLNVISSPYHIQKQRQSGHPTVDYSHTKLPVNSASSTNISDSSVRSFSPQLFQASDLDAVSVGSTYSTEKEIPATELDTVSVGSAYQRTEIPATELDTVSVDSAYQRTEIPATELDTVSVGSEYQSNKIPVSELDTISVGSAYQRTEIPATELDNVSVGSAYQRTEIPATALDTVSVGSAYQRTESPATELDTVSVCSAYQRKEIPATELDTVSVDSAYQSNKIPVSELDTVSVGSAYQRTEIPATELDTFSVGSAYQSNKIPVSELDTVSIGSAYQRTEIPATELDTVSIGSAYQRTEIPATELDTVSVGSACRRTEIPIYPQLVLASDLNAISVGYTYNTEKKVPATELDTVSVGSAYQSNNIPVSELDTVSVGSAYQSNKIPVSELDTFSLGSAYHRTEIPATELDTVSIGSATIKKQSPIPSQVLPATDLDTVSLNYFYNDNVTNQGQFRSVPQQALPVSDLDTPRPASSYKDTVVEPRPFPAIPRYNLPASDLDTVSVSSSYKDTIAEQKPLPLAIPQYKLQETDIEYVSLNSSNLSTTQQQQTVPFIDIDSVSLPSNGQYTDLDSDSINALDSSYKDNITNLTQIAPVQYYPTPYNKPFSATQYNSQDIGSSRIDSSEKPKTTAAPHHHQQNDGDMEIALPPPIEFSDTLGEPAVDVYIKDSFESHPNTFTFVSDTENSFVGDIYAVHRSTDVIQVEGQIPTEELLLLEASFRALEEEASPDNFLENYQDLDPLEEVPYESASSCDSKLAQCYEVVAPIQSIYTDHKLIGTRDSFNVPAEFADGGDEILQVIQNHDTNTFVISQFQPSDIRDVPDSPIPSESDYYNFMSTMDKNSEAMFKDSMDLEYEMLPEGSRFQTRIELGSNIPKEIPYSGEENPVAEAIAQEIIQDEAVGYRYYMESDEEPDDFPTADLPENPPDLPDSAPPDIGYSTPYVMPVKGEDEIVTATKGLDVKLVPSASAPIAINQSKPNGPPQSEIVELEANWRSQTSDKHKDYTVFNTKLAHTTSKHHTDDEAERAIVPSRIERKVEIPQKLFQQIPVPETIVTEPETIVPVQVKRKYEIPSTFKNHFPEKQAETPAPLPETIVQPRKQIVTVTTKLSRPAVPPKPSPRRYHDTDSTPTSPPIPLPRKIQEPMSMMNKSIVTGIIDTHKIDSLDPVKEDVLIPAKVIKKEYQITVNYKEPEATEQPITPTIVAKDKTKLVNNVIHIVNSMKNKGNEENKVNIASIIPVENNNANETVKKQNSTLKQTTGYTDGDIFNSANVLSPPKQDVIVTSKETIRKPVSSTISEQEVACKEAQKSLCEGIMTKDINYVSETPLNLPVSQSNATADTNFHKSNALDISEITIPRLHLGSNSSDSESSSQSSEHSQDRFARASFKTTIGVNNSETEKLPKTHLEKPETNKVFKTTIGVSSSETDPTTAEQPSYNVTSIKKPDGGEFKMTIDVINSDLVKPSSTSYVAPQKLEPKSPKTQDELVNTAYKTDATMQKPETTGVAPVPEKPVGSLAPAPQIKPISKIQPRSFNPNSLPQTTKVQYRTTISTLGMKPTGLFGRSSLKETKMDHPIKRMETLPFEVLILKGILGIGIKTTMTPEGQVKVTEILPSGPVGREGNIKVGDYLMSINGTELTGLPDSKVQQILRLLPRGLSKIVASAVPPEPSTAGSKPGNKETTERKTLSPRQYVPLPAHRQMTITTTPSSLLLSTRQQASSIKSVPLPSQRNINKPVSAVVSPRSPVESVSPSVSPRSLWQHKETTSQRPPPPVAPKPKKSAQSKPDAISKTNVADTHITVPLTTKEETKISNVPSIIIPKTSDYVTSARKTSPRGLNDVNKEPLKNDKEMGPIETEIFVSINGPKDEYVPQQQTGSIVLPGSVKYDSLGSKVNREWTPGVVSSASIGQPIKTKTILDPVLTGKIDVVESMPSHANTDSKLEHDHTIQHEHVPDDNAEYVASVSNTDTDNTKGNRFSFKASLDSEFEFDTSPTCKQRSMSTSSDSSYTEFTECNVEDTVIPEQIDEELDSDVDISQNRRTDNQTSESVPKLNSGVDVVTVHADTRQVGVAKSKDNSSTIDEVDPQDVMSHLDVGHDTPDENLSTASYEEDFETDDDLNENLESEMIGKGDTVEDQDTAMLQKVAEEIVSDVLSSIKPSDIIRSTKSDVQTGDEGNRAPLESDESTDSSGDDCPPPVPLSPPPPIPTSAIPELFDNELPTTHGQKPNTLHYFDVVNTDVVTEFRNERAPSLPSQFVVISDYSDDVLIRQQSETYVTDDSIEVAHYSKELSELPVANTDTDFIEGKENISGYDKQNVSDSLAIQEEDLPKESEAISLEKSDVDRTVETLEKPAVDETENENDDSINAVISLYSNIEKSLCTDENESAFKVYVPETESNTFQEEIYSPTATLERRKNNSVHSAMYQNFPDEIDSCDTKSITSSDDLLSDNEATDILAYSNIHPNIPPTTTNKDVTTVIYKSKVETSMAKVETPPRLVDINGGDLNGHGVGVTSTVATTPISPTFSDTSVGDVVAKPRGKYSAETDRIIRLMSTDEEPMDKGEGEIINVKMNKGFTGVGFVIQGGKGSPKGDMPISIKRLFKGGSVEQCGQLQVADELLVVNGEDFTTMRHNEAWQTLKFLPIGEISMKIRRYND